MNLISVKMVPEDTQASSSFVIEIQPDGTRYRVRKKIFGHGEMEHAPKEEFGPYSNLGPAMTRFHEIVGKLTLSGFKLEAVERRE